MRSLSDLCYFWQPVWLAWYVALLFTDKIDLNILAADLNVTYVDMEGLNWLNSNENM